METGYDIVTNNALGYSKLAPFISAAPKYDDWEKTMLNSNVGPNKFGLENVESFGRKRKNPEKQEEFKFTRNWDDTITEFPRPRMSSGVFLNEKLKRKTEGGRMLKKGSRSVDPVNKGKRKD